MTLQTNVYKFLKFAPKEPAYLVSAIVNQHADALEAAFTKAGIAPLAPADVQALLAKWPGAWQPLPLVIANAGFVTGHGCTYRREAGRAWGRGWSQVGTSGVAGNATLLSAPLPAEYRPSASVEVWPIGTSTNRPYRVILDTAGNMFAADTALPAGAFLNWDRATWPLG